MNTLVLLGHSLLAQNGIQCRMPGTILQDMLPNVQVWNLARDGNTAFRTLNSVDWNGQGTILDHIKALQPTHLIWSLEVNETGIGPTKLNVDNRTMTDLVSDARMLFVNLRADCPNTKLIYAQSLTGAMLTTDYVTLASQVRNFPWDGWQDLAYEQCVGAAQDCGDPGLIDFAHPTRLTAMFEAAQLASGLGPWFDLPNMMLPQWNNVAAFRAGLKAGDQWALSAKKSILS